MKKDFLMLILMFLTVIILHAQDEVIVRFTASTESGQYCPFDAVNVTNVTRGWTETLTYPDTVLAMHGSVGVIEHKTKAFHLGNAFPNPFHDETHVFLELPEPTEVLLRAFRVDGSEAVMRKMYLEAGTHRVTVSLSSSQMVFLSATTPYGIQAVKLLCLSSGREDAIIVGFVTPETETITQETRGDATGEFEPGDVMRYEALLLDAGTTLNSTQVEQAQYGNAIVVLQFDVNNPTVSTSEPNSVTQTTASCGGQVSFAGGLSVSARGVCWDTSPNPTINNSHTTDGMGTGTFVSNIIGLTAGTTYYVRAYATNRIGTAYGAQKIFTTLDPMPGIEPPTVTTGDVSNIRPASAICGGNVVNDGNGTVIARGVCWSALQTPTIYNSHTDDGSGVGSFTSNINGLGAGTTYYVRAYAINSAGVGYGNLVSFTTTMEGEWVDLGLPSGLLWATCNVGAICPEGFGDYFSWGEIHTKEYYDWSTYQYCNGSYNTLTKYCSDANLGYNGYHDNLTILQSSDDAATNNYGARWRIPTKLDWEELYNNTTRTCTTQNGVRGLVFTASNGNSIFLPAAGFYSQNNYTGNYSGCYWSSSLFTSAQWDAWCFDFSTQVNICYTTGMTRSCGLSVRPVRSSALINVISFPLEGGTVSGGGRYPQGHSCTVSAAAATGYVFSNWTENGAQVSSDVTYTFTVNNNRTLVANFTSQSLTYNVLVSANPAEGGAVTGGGSFLQGQSCTVSATAATGYVFLNWTENGVQISTDATYTFTVNGNRTLVANFMEQPPGVINGLFTINVNGDQVYFSQGNLQYQASTDTWCFATNQWDIIGESNNGISPTYNGWIDLFGWGTSGYDHGAVCYQPWSTSTNANDYFAYGNSSYNLDDATGQADWGYNPISNGGNIENAWRTLSQSEWAFVFENRMTNSGIRYAKATINGTQGIILLPDNWNINTYSLNSTNEHDASFSSNIINVSVWTNIFETNGAVFLPLTGNRSENTIGYMWDGDYWSSSKSGSIEGDAKVVSFDENGIYLEVSALRSAGFGVRLVQNADF